MIIRIIVVIILCAFSFLGGSYVATSSIDWVQITSVTLILTLIAIIIYTVETGRLRKATVQQTELNLRPLIIPVVELRGTSQRYYLKNIGRGPALRIKMDDIPLVEEFRVIYSFDEIDILSQKEKEEAIVRIDDKVCTDFHSAAIMPRVATHSFDFVIKYVDINNKEYQTKGKLGKGGVVIEGTK